MFGVRRNFLSEREREEWKEYLFIRMARKQTL
jgi:hypothetical protein